jgi:hypothetical protein
MSSPTDRIYGPGDPSPYAPRWVRNAQRRAPADQREGDADAESVDDAAGLVTREEYAPPLAAAAPVAADDEFLVGEFRVPRSLDPGIVPDPWAARGPRLRRSRMFGMLGRLALAGSLAAAVALIALGKLSLPGANGATAQGDSAITVASRYSGPSAKPQDPPPVAAEATSEPKPQAAPAQPAPATPPVLALAPAAPAPAEAAQALEPAPAALALDPDAPEVAALVKRGQELAASGDVAAARLTLRRAAEAHNAQAALALGATYDPIVLQTLGIFGVTPDVQMARSWYEKAKDYGSAEAPRRLELLATRAH